MSEQPSERGRVRMVATRRLSLAPVAAAGLARLERVPSAAFAPDGSFLATGGGAGTVQLWDPSCDRLLETLTAEDVAGRGEAMSTVRAGGDHRMLLAAVSGDGTLSAWEPRSGERLSGFESGPEPVSSVAVSPDGALLAAAAGDTVCLWDPWAGRLVRRLDGHRSTVYGVAFDPGGTRLASVAEDEIRIWDRAGGRLVRVLRAGTGRLSRVAFHPDGDRVAGTVWSEGTVLIWDAGSGQELLALRSGGDGAEALAFSPDGTHLAVGGWRSLRLWDPDTGAERCRLLGRRMGNVRSVVFHPDGARLVTLTPRIGRQPPPGSYDQPIGLWRIVETAGGAPAPTRTGRTLRDHAVSGAGHRPRAVTYHPDGTRLAVTGVGVRIWDLSGGPQEDLLLSDSSALADAVFSPDGATLAGADLNTVILWDPDTGRELRRWRSTDTGIVAVGSLAFHPDGGQLAASLGDNSIARWRPGDGRALPRLTDAVSNVSSSSSSLAFSPDGTLLARGGEDGTSYLYVWNLVTGECVRLHGHTDDVVAVAFHPAGGRLASGGIDRSIVLWDPGTGAEIRELSDQPGRVTALAFSPGGTVLATADSTGVVFLRDPATGVPAHRLTGHTGPVRSLAFRPDGGQLATAGADRTVRLWDLPAADR